MGQIRLYHTASKDQAEQLYKLLEAAFEEDAFPLAITEINEEKEIYEVSLYLEEEERDNILPRFADAISMPVKSVDIEVLPDIDWVKHSLEGLKPVRAGRFFVYGQHDRSELKPTDIGIEIEAGQAFGTGHHGTTAGCLEMIEAVMTRENPRNILDLGTGSGVLAIGMAKLQPAKVLATDIDPIATQVAEENIRLNDVQTQVCAATATGFDSPVILERTPFDLIVANILALPLIELAPTMRKHLKDHGSIILSGILDSQEKKVLTAYHDEGFEHQQTYHRGSWVTLHLKPKAH